MISIDWLSVNYHGIYTDSKLFAIKHLPTGTKMFKNVTELYHSGELLATLIYNPRSTVLNAQLIQMKIANRYLYHEGLFDLVNMLESDLNLQFIGFSRLDICYDFHLFSYNLHPEVFIKKVASAKIIKKGLSNYKFFATTLQGCTFEYLKIGSDTSNMCGYLYNKTLEMNKIKLKPYIQKAWFGAGLSEVQDVWRLEFSIKGDSWQLINNITGEDYKHNVKMLDDKDLLTNLFSLLLDKIFIFYYNNKKIRKDRNQKVILFSEFDKSHLLINYCSLKDSTRADKIFINKLLQTYDELRALCDPSAEEYLSLAKSQSNSKLLSSTFDKKLALINFNL